jgi:hypothetical protein
MVLFSFCFPSCSSITFSMLKLAKEANIRQHPGFFLFTCLIHHYFYFLSQLYAYQKKKKNRFNSELAMVVLFSYFSRSRSSTTSSHRWGWTSAARMDKCSANSVDSGNVHKAAMVMNGFAHQCVCIGDVGVYGGHVHRRLMSKMLGRIGDSPLIRFGTYTCDACVVSCMLKWDVATVMEYKGLPLQQAIDYCVRCTMQNIRRQLLSIISQYKLFTNLY